MNMQPMPREIIAPGVRLPPDPDRTQPARSRVKLVFPIHRQIEQREPCSRYHVVVNRRFRRWNLERLLRQAVPSCKFLRQVLKLHFAIEIHRRRLLAQRRQLGEQQFPGPGFPAERFGKF